jgi:pilus assembly protein CpaE
VIRAAVQRVWREERGAETVEFLGTLPLVILTIAIIWQFALLGYTAVITAGTAREAARAAAVGADCRAAAAQASVGWDSGTRRVSCSCGGETCRATVDLQVKRAPLPLIGRLPSYPWVSSTAYMRYEPPYR